MGALDDAIREHLELKRRHGASEDEIKQAEAEALGPARRVAGGGAGALPGETALDEAGMPAPVEAFESPPEPGRAVHAPPPPPPDLLDESVADPAAVPPEHFLDEPAADPAAVPPPGIEPEPLVPSQPLSPVDPEPLHGAVAAGEVEAEPEPVQPASPAHGVVEPPPVES